MTEKELARLLSDAKKDKPLKEKLIATRSTDNPVEDFCALARSLGYEAIFYRADMDIIDTTA